MLLWLAFSSELAPALGDSDGDLLFSVSENQNIDAFWVALSLDVFRCTGELDQTNEVCLNISAYGILLWYSQRF